MSGQTSTESDESLTQATLDRSGTQLNSPALPQSSSFMSPSSQGSGSSIRNQFSFMNNYQPPVNLGSVQNQPAPDANQSPINMSVSAAISGASATLAHTEEPELKKVKLAHFNFFKNQLFPDSAKHGMKAYASQGRQQNMYTNHKKLEERIGGILCCTVCLDLPSTAIYQCNNGHLMCAGCFQHLLADARLKDEQSTCPNCRCEISKSSCSRNLAVEKTLSELPASCQYCNELFARNCVEGHQRNECIERPSKCSYQRIGCTWEGPFHELKEHDDNCGHPNRPCREIIDFLQVKDSAYEEEEHALSSLVNMLSYEKICFNDLQFKQYRTDELTPKLYFETNRFSAFFHQWVLKARLNDNQKNPNLSLNRHISIQLILKSRLSSSQSSLEIKFCVLKGPFGEVPISPRVHMFEFNANKLETDYIKLDIKPADCNKLLSSKIINFRCFMFQV